ncbi:amino acid ABC transporter substrate-binding protein [Agaribacterium haliotis]|uniref:amino acid ABC transporter substrate-binding protein n=1 Tax=Agaribacterium haliotis TaxID=2013869 RepID=UPI001178C03B|nr:amino acid ABC transporter substrate-binding protein [Agaribacterium haliotis]
MAPGTPYRLLIFSLYCLLLYSQSNTSLAAADKPSERRQVRVGIVQNINNPELAVFSEILASPKADLSQWWYRFPSAAAVQQALTVQLLAYGELDADIVYVRYPTHKRLIEQLIQGKVHIAAETLWASQLRPHRGKLALSEPLLRIGEYEKGFYTHPDKLEHLKNLPVSELKKLSVAIGENWDVDEKALKHAGFHNIKQAIDANALFKIIHAGRADLTILEFSGHPGLMIYAKDMSDHSDISLAPIPGLKILLPDERIFAVSVLAPGGDEVLRALNLGLQIMREKNLILPLMRRTGMLSEKTAGWKRINDL